ncbi:hypothetical protein FHU36_005585 [Nonomuraea muscovyensis]|uniref:Secreted protein n=1 Tax=Nonomuraea muscovyensis TaxID=1124761 RepID=A0A7X0F1K5_9ACTN|nr:hypothetical protein [Nonomuraea muscovyensis]MBB6349040.1 hypothetical protein [Nonomuraea muscovyensis]
MRNTLRRGRVLGTVSALALAAALTLAGCGADDGGGSDVASATGGGAAATGSAAPSLSNDEKGVKFAQCMRENGIDMADPQPGKGVMITGKPGSEETMAKAMDACKQYQPTGGTGPGAQQNAERMRALAQCMRDNGVPDFPDPEPGGGLRVTADIAGDPDFEAAQQKCRLNPGGS